MSSHLVQIRTKAPPTRFNDHLQTGTDVDIDVDVRRMRSELEKAIEGEVRFEEHDRGMYAHDASNYRMVPIGVVLPKSANDVAAAVAICRRYSAPIFARGGGTGIPGQTVNNGVLFDFSKYMHSILELDADKKYARVQPGVVLDTLRDTAEKHELTFGPDPATHSRCTLGGMIGNNSCGVHSVMGGRTADNIEELDVLLYDGTRMTVGKTSEDEIRQIIRSGGRQGEVYGRLRVLRDKYADLIRSDFPDIPRRVSGYNLPQLLPENDFHVARALVGSECTCVLVLEAKTKLIDSPQARSLLVLGYEDIFHAGDHVVDPMEYGPIALEALDDSFIQDMKVKGLHPMDFNMMPDGGAWLLVEFGGKDKDESDANARRLMADLKTKRNPPSMKLFDVPAEEQLVWDLREAGLGATAKVPGRPDNHEGWEDSAVPPESVGKYLRDLKGLMDKFGYYGSLYGHFGQGCIHTRLNFDLETRDGIDAYRSFVEEAADLVHRYNGSLSGEHGDGQARGELLPRMYKKEIIQAFREFKEIWDPEWKMNPGKLIDPYRNDDNLRLGTKFNPHVPQTQFSFHEDDYNFVKTTERCVGAGVCRRHGGGTMCPSYMVTMEEKHSTRGRARLLGEMIRGDTIQNGWKSEAVKEALDLCLACKGCKGDCPVKVDMATYKAEFLYHYFKGRLRPRSAYTMGRIHRWAGMASLMPGIVNYFSHAPLFKSVAKWIANVHPEREIPKFAPQTFKSWFENRDERPQETGKPEVILWADTFNNHFHPNVAKAATEVLETAGYRVTLPDEDLCCARPLYDWGMLDEARSYLTEIIETLREPIRRGVHVVVLEPSCASVFHEELINLFPHDEDAKRLSNQAMPLDKFLNGHAKDLQLPKLNRKALVHGHCHHKSIFKMDDEKAILDKMGVDYSMPESGCCGMAGAFGFEREHFEISQKCGERVLLPAVRDLDRDSLIITDGFSCHEQIRQNTGRDALHLAELIQMAIENDRNGSNRNTTQGDKRT